MTTIDELYQVLYAKVAAQDPSSGTVRALELGVHSIGKKIVEEAAEVWMAAEHEDEEALATEISQLIYHLLVMMLARGLTPDDIYKRL